MHFAGKKNRGTCACTHCAVLSVWTTRRYRHSSLYLQTETTQLDSCLHTAKWMSSRIQTCADAAVAPSSAESQKSVQSGRLSCLCPYARLTRSVPSSQTRAGRRSRGEHTGWSTQTSSYSNNIYM